MASVTLTVAQLQDLLQAQTASLETLVTNQIATLQQNLEASIDDKLQAKFDDAEASVKKFMKESIEDSDDEEDDASVMTRKANEDLSIIKDHVLQMEQNMTRMSSGSSGGADDSIASGLLEVEIPAAASKSAAATPYSKTPTSTKRASTSKASATAVLEQTLQDACQRMEDTMDDNMAHIMKQVDQRLTSVLEEKQQQQSSSSNNVKRSTSMDKSNSSSASGSAAGSLMRMNQHQFEDLLSKRMSTMEQFIDARHAELEAYYSSAADKLHKLVVEAIQDVSFKKGGVTKAELEAVLDARMAEDDDDIDDDESDNTNSRADISPKKHQEPAITTTDALGKLIQQQQDWIDLQTSTSELEMQVQSKLQTLEAAGGAGEGAALHTVKAKLESLEQVVLAAMASTSSTTGAPATPNRAKKKRATTSSKKAKGGGVGGMDDSSKRASVSEIADRMQGGNSKSQEAEAATGNNVYMDVSVDGERLRAMNADLDESGNPVKSFMNTLNNWRDINTKEKGIREHSNEDDEDDVEISDSDSDNNGDDDDDDVADGHSSNESLSVDSSFDEGDNHHESPNNRAVVNALLQLETKLDRLDDKVKTLAKKAKNSGGSGLHVDEVEEMVNNAHDTLKSDLKEWLLEQQDELNSGGQSESGQATGGDIRREATASYSSSQDDLEQIRGKLNTIEAVVSTNQGFLQEQRQLAVAPVPRALPLQKDIMMSTQSTSDLERKILNHLDTMDKSVQFKLDEIFAELQTDAAAKRGSGLTALSLEDQGAIVKAIQAHLRQMQTEIASQLKESIPDYGMTRSVVAENLEEMRQIVSEVAISEVELLKTQLGVAEEAEQEALHAIVVLRGQLEETKEQDRRPTYAPPGAPGQQQDTTGGMFSFGPFGNLAGALGGGAQPQRPPRETYRSRNLSMASNGSGLSLGYENGGRSVGSGPIANKRKSPAHKLEGWKHQFADLEDKATDLRNLYSQLRGQDAEDWMANKAAPVPAIVPSRSSLKPSGRYAAGESKEMEDLTDADGDWI